MTDASSEAHFVAADSAQDAPKRWRPLTLLGFRFAFCYFMLYALCCGNATIWEIIPFGVGDHIEEWLNWPFSHGAQALAQHVFHVKGIAGTLHPGGSGDKLLDWISLAIMLSVAVLAALVWSILDRRATRYPKLYFWFRFTLRLTLGVSMLDYGFAKVFPLQMAPPQLGVLNEPFGSLSPMTLLWSMIGLYPLYETICGAAEVVSGLLILFRRTALLGALLTAFVVSNVVLYNYFFDVPVKIYATHLLLMALVYIAPDVRSLFHYFILHKPTAPSGGWTRPARRYGLRVETIVTAVTIALVISFAAVQLGQTVSQQRNAARHPSPLVGIWHVDSVTRPLLTPENQNITEIEVEPNGTARLRDASRQLWRAGVNFDAAKHTLALHSIDIFNTYAVAQPDPAHLTLTPTGKDAAKTGTLQLTRIPIPAQYPLQQRGFHFVNEWGLER